jgi:Cu2+-exporting ATPase
MERALAQKPAAAAMADRAAGWFVAALLVTTLGALIFWLSAAPERAVPVAIALLVITCPCAISLAAPAALTAAGYRLASAGLIPVRAQCIENLADVTDILLDKTGTLTEGKPALTHVLLLSDGTEANALAIAAALERGSEHPVGRALLQASREHLIATELVNRPGAGIEGRIAGTIYRIGTPQFVGAIAGSMPAAEMTAGQTGTVVALGSSSGWIALLQFSDTPRPAAVPAMRRLQGRRPPCASALGRFGCLLPPRSPDSVGIAHKHGRRVAVTEGRYCAQPSEERRRGSDDRRRRERCAEPGRSRCVHRYGLGNRRRTVLRRICCFYLAT